MLCQPMVSFRKRIVLRLGGELCSLVVNTQSFSIEHVNGLTHPRVLLLLITKGFQNSTAQYLASLPLSTLYTQLPEPFGTHFVYTQFLY